MSFEWFRPGHNRKNLMDLAEKTIKDQEKFIDLTKTPHEGAKIPDDQEKQIIADAEFNNKELETYAVYSREAEERLGEKHKEIEELRKKIDALDVELHELTTGKDLDKAFNERGVVQDEIQNLKNSITYNIDHLEEHPQYQLLTQKLGRISHKYDTIKNRRPEDVEILKASIEAKINALLSKVKKLTRVYGEASRNSLNN